VTAVRVLVDLQVIGEVADGLEAVQKTVELKPDLVLMDKPLGQR
jgi:AmiR/NasT family two-component response regulator